MLFTSAYEDLAHNVLVIDTRQLVQAERKNIRLSAINRGSTRPVAFRRDLTLFKTFEDYSFQERRRKYGKARAIAEVCVIDRVAKIADVVIEVNTDTEDEIVQRLDH